MKPSQSSAIVDAGPSDSDYGGGLWQRQPVLGQLLGLSPMLVLATTLNRALAFALLSALVYLATTLTLTLTHNPMRASWRYLYYFLILALYTTMAERLAYFLLPALHDALRPYGFLIACNFVILTRLESSAASPSWSATLSRSAGLVLIYSVTLLGFAALREALTTGGVSLDWQLFSSQSAIIAAQPLESAGSAFMATPAMGLILLGLLAAAWNWIALRWPARGDSPEVEAVERARVTGRLRDRKSR